MFCICAWSKGSAEERRFWFRIPDCEMTITRSNYNCFRSCSNLVTLVAELSIS